MQNVQRWSQPFCTCTNARARPSSAVDEVRRGLPHRHDVVDRDLFLAAEPERRRVERIAGVAPGRRDELLLVAERRGRLRHGGKRVRLDLRRAAGDDDARVRPLAREPADRLRACRTASAVTAQVLTTTVSPRPARRRASRRMTSDSVGVEPAAEGDDVDAHHAAPAAANSAGSKRPSNSYATGPVISTWSSRSRHSISEVAARQRHRHLAVGAPQPRRGDRRRAGGRAAGLGQAGAALPGAHDDVLARDHVRQRDIGALRKHRMVFEQRPDLAEVVGVDVVDPEDRVRIAHAHHRRRMQDRLVDRPDLQFDRAGVREISPPAESRSRQSAARPCRRSR